MRPLLWPTLFTVPALILLILLGNWQVRRLYWKQDLIAKRAAALAAPETALPDEPISEPDLLSHRLEFHHVVAAGRLLNSAELYLHAGDLSGHEGYHVVTPLLREDGSIVLIDRGFVPEARKDPSTRMAGEPEGKVEIHGILRREAPPAGWLVPKTQVADNFWLRVDIAGMAEADRLPAGKVLPFYIEAGPLPNPGGLPFGGQTRSELPNDHLQYAITWYGFAVTLAIVYILYHRRKPPA